MPILNPPNQGGVVTSNTSNTFNLIRITTLVAGLLGVSTAILGIEAEADNRFE